MGIIRDEILGWLHEDFSKSLKNEVDVVVFTNETTEHCDTAFAIAKELSGLNGKIHFIQYDVDKNLEASETYRVSRAPTTIIAKHGEQDGRIRFTGLPSGYEFTSLVEIIKNLSRNEASLTGSTLQRVAAVSVPTEIRVFVTPTCPYSPRIVQAAHKFAMMNPNIRTDIIEALEFHDLASEAGVNSVPHVAISNGNEFEGAFPEETFASYVSGD